MSLPAVSLVMATWTALRDALRERASPDQRPRAQRAIALLEVVARWLSPTPSRTARSSA